MRRIASHNEPGGPAPAEKRRQAGARGQKCLWLGARLRSPLRQRPSLIAKRPGRRPNALRPAGASDKVRTAVSRSIACAAVLALVASIVWGQQTPERPTVEQLEQRLNSCVHVLRDWAGL